MMIKHTKTTIGQLNKWMGWLFSGLMLSWGGAYALDSNPLLTAAQWHTPLATSDGGQLKLAQFKGQVIYLDFWASWCPPCRQSFPWMAELHRKYAQKGLVIIANSVDEQTRDALDYLSSQQPPFVVTFDPEGVWADQFKVPGMPTSYLIDRQGHIRMQHIGFKLEDAKKIEAAIERLLGEQP